MQTACVATHEECVFAPFFFSFFLFSSSSMGCWCGIVCVCACVWHLTEDKCDRNGVSGPIICNIRPATFKSTHIRAIFRVTATFCADSFNPKSSHPSSFTLSLHPPLFFSFSLLLPHLSTAADFAVSVQWFRQWEKCQLYPSPPLLLLSHKSYPTSPPLPSLFPSTFLFTLPSRSYSIFLLILCHSPLPFLHLSFPSSLSLCRPFPLPPLPVLSQSFSSWLPAPSLSLLTHSHLPSLRLNPGCSGLREYSILSEEKLTEFGVCVCVWVFLLGVQLPYSINLLLTVL